MVIKDKIASGHYKFMSLVFLKEVTKTNDGTLANYLDIKILKRLYQLTMSPDGQNCLMAYDRKVVLADSAKFHYLLRECFTNWGSKFKTVNKNYISYTKKLSKKNLVPAPEERFWNYPEGAVLAEPLRGNSIRDDFSADHLSRNGSDLEISGVGRSRSPSPNIQPIKKHDESGSAGSLMSSFVWEFQGSKRTNSVEIAKHRHKNY